MVLISFQYISPKLRENSVNFDEFDWQFSNSQWKFQKNQSISHVFDFFYLFWLRSQSIDWEFLKKRHFSVNLTDTPMRIEWNPVKLTDILPFLSQIDWVFIEMSVKKELSQSKWSKLTGFLPFLSQISVRILKNQNFYENVSQKWLYWFKKLKLSEFSLKHLLKSAVLT